MYPKRTIAWHVGGLRNVLGGAYTRVVSEDLVYEVSIAHGLETKKGPLTPQILHEAFVNALLQLGVNEQDIKKLEEPKIVATVHKDKLLQIANRAKLSLEGTGDVTTSYVLKPGPYKPKDQRP